MSMVAKLEPVERDIKQQMIKVTAVNPAADNCNWLATQSKALTKPVSDINTPMVEANIQAVNIIMTMG